MHKKIKQKKCRNCGCDVFGAKYCSDECKRQYTLKRGLALTPVDAMPGSTAKIEVLRRRAELRLPLWNDSEPRYFDSENQLAKVAIGAKTGRKNVASDELVFRVRRMHEKYPNLNHHELARRTGAKARQVQNWLTTCSIEGVESKRCVHCGAALIKPECLRCRLELDLPVALDERQADILDLLNAGLSSEIVAQVYGLDANNLSQILLDLRDRVGLKDKLDLLRWRRDEQAVN
ncbi:MAG: hypothetical protein SFV81_20220 [Pirellulaceae bacterium]|nr:hypothetical protein [Pirellulaceae bacterium]